MSQITAVIADTSSIGYVRSGIDATNSTYANLFKRRNPQNAVARIRTVMNPHMLQEVPGGLLSFDFTIPAEEAQRWRPMLRYGAYCWVFDGSSPIFYGQILDQPSWTPAGDAQVVVSGPWVMLGKSRVLEVWELRDLGVWTQSSAANEKRDASVQIRGDGSLMLAFANGVALTSGQFVAVEYVLPSAGGNGIALDVPVITGFEVHVSDAAFNSNVNLTFRVQQIASYGGTGTTVYSTTTTGSSLRQTADNVFSENTGGTWGPSQGLRFGIHATAATTPGGSATVVVDRMRITTRQSLFPSNSGSHDTAAIARDLLQPQQLVSAGTFRLPQFFLPEPFWPGDTTNVVTTDATVKYGLDALTGTGSAPDSGVAITGFNILQMTSPSEVLLQLAGIDGYHVGFYLPYNQRGGYDAGNVNDVGQSLWLSARPQLYYQAWPDPKTAPDYTIQIREGASVQNDDQRQQMLNIAYANYQTTRGAPDTSTMVDGDPRLGVFSPSANYLTNQGFRAIEDWTIDASVNAETADSLAKQMLEVRRTPSASSTVTITNDGTTRWPILKNGAQVPHLSMIRPGSVRVVDVPAAGGLRQGYATRVEWWGQTLEEPEHVELTLSDPGQMLLERRIAWSGMRANRQRVTGRGVS